MKVYLQILSIIIVSLEVLNLQLKVLIIFNYSIITSKLRIHYDMDDHNEISLPPVNIRVFNI